MSALVTRVRRALVRYVIGSSVATADYAAVVAFHVQCDHYSQRMAEGDLATWFATPAPSQPRRVSDTGHSWWPEGD